MDHHIAAVIVAYYPNAPLLEQLVHDLCGQCGLVIVVDNSEPPCGTTAVLAKKHKRLVVASMGHNAGIASAQNQGIKYAVEHRYEAILLFDQDSVVNDGFAEGMWKTYLAASESDTKPVAAVGPRYTDMKQHAQSPFVKISGLRILRIPCLPSTSFVEVDCLIASGSLLLTTALQAIGLMREDLFIDYVDTEWCLRAKQTGYRCIGACSVEMQHSIGDEVALLWRYRFPLHSPLRHYYLVRNATALYFRSSLPLQWKVADGIRLFCKFCIYSVLGKPRATHMRMMLRGFWHGIIGRMGRL
jgi:rhamnosyltransferase